MSGDPADDESLLRVGLDALALPVCVVNSAGVVRTATSAWGRDAPGGPHDARAQFNLLRALEHGAAGGDVHARLAHDGIASVLGRQAGQFRLEYPAGVERKEWRLLEIAALPDGGAVLTHGDVTARRSAEARLRQLSRRYDAATEAGTVVVWELNLETKTVAVDALLHRTLGYPPRQTQSWDEWRARVHADDAAVVDAVWQATCAQPAAAGREHPFGPLEVRLADAHGGYRCFECSGRVVPSGDGRDAYAHGTLHDVTTRRIAQDALQRSNAHLQELARRLAGHE